MKSIQHSVLQRSTGLVLLLAMLIQPFSVIAEELIDNQNTTEQKTDSTSNQNATEEKKESNTLGTASEQKLDTKQSESTTNSTSAETKPDDSIKAENKTNTESTGQTTNSDSTKETTKETPIDSTVKDETKDESSDSDDTTPPAEETDDIDIDLGDSNNEMDALKDFTAVVRQSTDYTCGPAALATLLTQLGSDTTEQQILDTIMQENIDHGKGVSMLTLKNSATALNQKVYAKTWTAEQVLSYIEVTGDPVLIHDEKPNVGGHFSVIKSYDGTLVEISDTEAGNIKYNVESFKHIYTGHVLIISDNPINNDLNNTDTDISDAELATIWGKYVPVYIMAENSSNQGAKNAAAVFKVCNANALKNTTVSLRNEARRNCYLKLGSDLGSALGNWDEVAFWAEYRLKDNIVNTVHKDTEAKMKAEIYAIYLPLRTAYDALNTDINALKTQYNTLATNTATALQNQINVKIQELNQYTAQKTLLINSLNPKQSTATSLQNELNNQTFTQNGTTFSLGVVNSALSAQRSSYSQLSASASGKLSSLQGQLNQLYTSNSSADSSRTTFSSQMANYKSSYTSYWSSYVSNNSNRNYYANQYNNSRNSVTRAYNLNLYNYYYNAEQKSLNNYNTAVSQYNSAVSNYTYYNNLIISNNTKIASLQSQVNSVNNQLSAVYAEQQRLERLQSFGNAEQQRKRTVLASLQGEINSLNSQLGPVNGKISQLNAEITNLKNTTLSQALINLKTTITNKVNELNAIGAKINDLVNNEWNTESVNEEKWDEEALSLVRKDVSTKVITIVSQTEDKIITSIDGVQKSLDYCSISMDGTTLVTGATGIGLPVAAGATAVGIGCDLTNGVIYAFRGDATGVGLSAFAVIPIVGSLGKTTGMIIKTTAEETASVTKVAREAKSVTKVSISIAEKFSSWINNGVADTVVYIGYKDGRAVYVGVTNDLKTRLTKHISVGKIDRGDQITTTLLTKNQARTIEQNIINANSAIQSDDWANAINSISAERDIYDSAVKWGSDFMKANGIKNIW